MGILHVKSTKNAAIGMYEFGMLSWMNLKGRQTWLEYRLGGTFSHRALSRLESVVECKNQYIDRC